MSYMLFKILVEETLKKTSFLSYSKQNFLLRWLYKILKSWMYNENLSMGESSQNYKKIMENNNQIKK
jgi:hypothetical protein